MSIVSTFGHGMVPTIFWSATEAEGVLLASTLIPMGAWCSKLKHNEDAAKAAQDTGPKGQKTKLVVEATLLRKKL